MQNLAWLLPVAAVIVVVVGIVVTFVWVFGKQTAWVALVGLVLICIGLVTLGVTFLSSAPWNTFVGSTIVLVGIVVTLVPVWFLYKKQERPSQVDTKDWSDVLKELIKKLPWVALVGLLLIYAGLVTLGVDFP